MQRKLLFLSISSFILCYLLFSGIDRQAFSSEAGSSNGGGNTGSNGDVTTCAQSFCHDDASPQLNSSIASISTTIPSSGYVPGQTYTITATINKSGHNKFGFELTSEIQSGAKTGMLSSTSSATQLTNGGDAVTHTASGTSGSGGKTWSMDWQAPSAGTGDVIFWAAFNVTNSNNSNSGDTIHTDSLMVQEDTSSTAIPSARMMEGASFEVFPNPASDHITLKSIPSGLKEGKLLLRDLQGRIVKVLHDGDPNRIEGRSFEVSELRSGHYLLEFKGEEEQKLRKIVLH